MGLPPKVPPNAQALPPRGVTADSAELEEDEPFSGRVFLSLVLHRCLLGELEVR
jgi:hypothetical protein